MNKSKLLLLCVLLLSIILRIYNLGINPPSLYWDEVSLGYNAYSILTSGRDEHGEFMPIARFIAFGDYKPPGYIYATVPSVFLFGLNEFAVRFPSALAGIFLVVVTYLLVVKLFQKRKLALLVGFVLSVSPWAIHFSRAAFEANLAALFNLLGIYFFLISEKRKSFLLLSVVSFIFSFYTFNANRIIAPIMLIGLSLIYFRQVSSNIRWLSISIVAAVILLWPSFSFLASKEGSLRFQEVSIFNNLKPVETANQRIALDGNSIFSKIMHNRRLIFASDFLKHYFDNFSGRFLFTHGDVNPRLNSQQMGHLYVWDLPFIIIGIILLIKKRDRSLSLLIFWMATACLPAATARETPHALRIISILPAYQIIIAYGLYQVRLWVKNKYQNISKLIYFAICLLFIVNCFYYLHNYYIHYPRDWSGEWQYGYKQMVQFVNDNEKNFDQIYVTEALGRPYIYFAFYAPYSGKEFTGARFASRDWFGFWTVERLGKVRFGSGGLNTASGKILLVETPGNIPDNFRIIKTIIDLKGEKIFEIAQNK